MISFYGQGVLNHLSGAHDLSTILVLASSRMRASMEKRRVSQWHTKIFENPSLKWVVLSCPLIGRIYRPINVTTGVVELESRKARRTFATVFWQSLCGGSCVRSVEIVTDDEVLGHDQHRMCAVSRLHTSANCRSNYYSNYPQNIFFKYYMLLYLVSLLFKWKFLYLPHDFGVLVLDRAVFTVARAQIKDLLGFEEADENRAFRYQACKQYTLWANGKLGRRSTSAIPACCSIAIREKYPDS